MTSDRSREGAPICTGAVEVGISALGSEVMCGFRAEATNQELELQESSFQVWVYVLCTGQLV